MEPKLSRLDSHRPFVYSIQPTGKKALSDLGYSEIKRFPQVVLDDTRGQKMETHHDKGGGPAVLQKAYTWWLIVALLSILSSSAISAVRHDSSEIPKGNLNNGRCRLTLNEMNFFPNGINQFVEITKTCDLDYNPPVPMAINMKFYKLLFISHDGYLLCCCNLAGQAKPKGNSKFIFFTIGDESMAPDFKISDCNIPRIDVMNGQRLPISDTAPIGVALVNNPNLAAMGGVDLIKDIMGFYEKTLIDSRLQKKIIENLVDFYVVASSSPYTHCEYFQVYYSGYNPEARPVLRDWAQLDDETERSLSRCLDASKQLRTRTDFLPFQPSLFVYAATSRGAPNLCSTATPFVIEDYQPKRKNPRYDFGDGFKCEISTEDPAIENLMMITSPFTYYEKLKELIRSRAMISQSSNVGTTYADPELALTTRILGDLEDLGKAQMPFEKKIISSTAFEEKLHAISPLLWENCDSFQPKELIAELDSMKNPPIYPDDILDNSTCFWMEWLPTKAMRCKLCNMLLQQGVIKDRPGSPKITKIMTTGQINKGLRAKTWNRGIIQKHNENPLHLQALDFARLFQSGLRGDELYQQFYAPGGLVRSFTNATENLLATAYALASVDLPFYRFPKIWELLVYLNASIGHLYGNAVSIKQLQVSISDMMHADLVKYLKEEKPEFSLLIDSSTDVASLPALAIVIQTFDKSKNIKLYLYKVIWISDRETAQVLWDHFMKQLKIDGLEEYLREKCVGFASDGGSNVLAFRRILQDYTDHGENMIMVHCFAHKSELVIKNAWKDQEFALSVEDTVNVLHRIFGSKSAKKKRHLQLAQEEVGDPGFSIKRVQKTRWVNSRLRALDKIVLHWKTIVKALRRVMDDKSIKDAKQRKLVEDTLENMKNPSFIMTTAFVTDVYTAMSTMSLKLQDRGTTLIGKKEKREKLKGSLNELKSNNGPFVQSILDQSKFSSPKFQGKPMTVESFEDGYVIFANTALNRPDLSNNDHALFKQRENYVDLILQQLDEYFPSDPTDDLDILDPTHWPLSSLEMYGNENLTMMNRKLKWNYEEDQLLNSWNDLKNSVSKHPEFPQKTTSLNPEEFWAFYLQESSITWSDGLRKIVKNVITVPASTAEVERVFSYYTQTKTLSRYNLDVETVDSLIRIRFNGPKSLQDFDTFRYVWGFLDSHSRSDDLSICAHRSPKSSLPQEDVCEEMEQATLSTIHELDSAQMDVDTSVKTSSTIPTSPSYGIEEYDFADRDAEDLDYDMSGILDAMELEERQGDGV